MLSHRRRITRPTHLILATALLAAACGTDDGAEEPETPPEDAAEAPDDAGDDDGEDEATDGDAPERVVSLSPTSTEVLFAIGAGDQVVAVDDQSNFPEEAPTTDLSGFQPNLEAIAAFEPDIVFLSQDVDGLVDGLESIDVEVVIQPAAEDLDEAFDQMLAAGDLTGNAEAASTLVDELRAEIDALLADAPDGDGLRYYHELDPNLFTATSTTFIGEVYGLFGLDNIADEAGQDTDFPQLSPEFVVDADPDLIFVTDASGDGPDEIAARPGWSTITAVEADAIEVLPTDVSSRWGPRVVEFVEAIAQVLDGVSADA